NEKMSEKKHKSLSIDTKYQIITAVDAGNKKEKATVDESGVLPNTLSTILKNRNKIPVKISVSEHKEAEDTLHMWFKSAANDNIPLSGPILAAKAKKLAADLGNENFTVSHVWIERFKKCWNVVSKSVCGESGSVDSTVADDYITSKLPALLKDYKTLAIEGENCHGGKHSRECIKVMVAANMDSSEKLKLLVIGKSQKSRRFKNVKSLPVDYKANTQAWMTSDIFSKWVKKFNRKMECQKCKVLLFIDNCPAHPTIATLKAITMIVLPPNSTSKLQPMDQGIIKSFKQITGVCCYSTLLLSLRSENTEINLLQAIQFAHCAWRKVTMRCTSSCFANAGFHINETNEETENLLRDEEDNIPLSELVESWKPIQVHMELSSDLTVEDYIDMDKHVVDSAQLTETEIVTAIKTQDSASGDMESESNEDCEPEEPKL
uniref:HTH CENPB-type domain-containing protein n=1 Tax=Latimeria chalumnae TaxID=7897 RepID=H3A146_LATCH